MLIIRQRQGKYPIAYCLSCKILEKSLFDTQGYFAGQTVKLFENIILNCTDVYGGDGIRS